MILKSVHIRNYKCIKDSNEFKIDDKVTCLVGKNESGKTAILQALSKLNSVDSSNTRFDDLEYPRLWLSDYEAISSSKPANALATQWVLSAEEVEKLRQVIGALADSIRTVDISKGYDNRIQYDLLIDQHGSAPDTKDKIIAILSSELPKFAYFSEYLRMPGQISINDLKKRSPNNYSGSDKIFLALLDMIGTSVEDLERINQHERLIAKLEAASNNITRQIFGYWTQNRHLRVQFRFEQALAGDPPPFNQGWILRTRIENMRHGVSTSFNERSAGFVWFFSFLVWFSQIRKQFGENLVILLDEPGLSLHAKAQADLLRYIEEQLAPKYQVIYTTHSPFMIDPSNLLRARTVEDVYLQAKPGEPEPDEPDQGTKIGDNVLSTDRDTIFPLQACLGYEISQTLFVGKHTLLVEGPSEVLYFQWFKRKLKAMERAALDERWVITPCGGIDKIPAFLSLFAGNQLNIAVVTDFARGNKTRVRDLRESKLLKDGRVLTLDTYASQEEADIEDIIGRQTYIELVNKAFALPPAMVLSADKLSKSDSRVVKGVESIFRTLPPEVREFDHYRPAEFLIQQGMDFTLPDLDMALNRFENLFKDLNRFLD